MVALVPTLAAAPRRHQGHPACWQMGACAQSSQAWVPVQLEKDERSTIRSIHDTRDAEVVVGIREQQAAVITHSGHCNSVTVTVTVTRASCRHGLARPSPMSWQKWPEEARSVGKASRCGCMHAASLPLPGPCSKVGIVPRLLSLGEPPPT